MLLAVSALGRGLNIWRVLHTCLLFLVVVDVVVLVVCCSSILYFCVCFSLCLTSMLDVAVAGAVSKPLASSCGRCFALLYWLVLLQAFVHHCVVFAGVEGRCDWLVIFKAFRMLSRFVTNCWSACKINAIGWCFSKPLAHHGVVLFSVESECYWLVFFQAFRALLYRSRLVLLQAFLWCRLVLFQAFTRESTSLGWCFSKP